MGLLFMANPLLKPHHQAQARLLSRPLLAAVPVHRVNRTHSSEQSSETSEEGQHRPGFALSTRPPATAKALRKHKRPPQTCPRVWGLKPQGHLLILLKVGYIFSGCCKVMNFLTSEKGLCAVTQIRLSSLTVTLSQQLPSAGERHTHVPSMENA